MAMSVTSLLPSDDDVQQSRAAIADALQKLAPFEDLPDAVRKALCETADRRRYDAGQTVYSVGQFDGGEFFAILEGVLKVTVTDPSNGAILIEEYHANSFFGLELAMADRPDAFYQSMSVTAERDLDVIAIDTEAFRSLAAQRPSLMRNLALRFARELASLRFEATPTETAPEQRVYAALLEYVARDEISGVWRIEKMPKHRELADIAGVDDAIAADAVAILISESIAYREYPGLIINDMARLNELAT